MNDKTSDQLWRGACEVAGGDPAQCIHDLRSELTTAKAQLAEWVRKADAARQPAAFYSEYSEGTMRAMQALLTDSRAELAAALAEITQLKTEIRVDTPKMLELNREILEHSDQLRAALDATKDKSS